MAQLIKVPWNFYITRKWDFDWLISSGGMPSAHTSAVTSLATSIGLTQGWDSPSFAIATIFGIIVMYDATGVRRHAGMHAQVLNQLVDDFALLLNELRHLTQKPSAESRVKLKEILGHQPIEVFTGAWFGILIALVLYWIWY
jgi:acid phosphatase family membrane protein YuiD